MQITPEWLKGKIESGEDGDCEAGNINFIRHCDNYGNVVEKPKYSHPYNYSPYVNWQHSEMHEDANGGFYTDRAFTWDHKKYNELCRKHFGNEGQYWMERAEDSPEKVEAWVRDYTGDQTLILTKVIESCNPSNGYPVWYLGYYTEKKDDKES